MFKRLLILPTIVLIMTPIGVYAHTGHGYYHGSEFLHYLSASHTIPAILLIGVLYFVLKSVQRIGSLVPKTE